MAVAIGDGAVRVWEADTTDDDDTKLCRGTVTTYWQNVQGKVLSIGWHPTKEHLLAFATAENRVGLIDASGKGDRSARTFLTALTHGVYSLCWGEGDALYACGGKTMVVYDASRIDQQPEVVKVSLEGHQWAIACAGRFSDGLLVVGSATGGVAVVDHSYQVLAANYVYTGMLYNVECHPLQTSESNEKSPYRNLIAVSANADKENSITILEYVTKEDGTKQLLKWKVLLGHKNTIHQLAWNPHRDELLVSTSLDSTVRVWDVKTGVCLSIFGSHTRGSMGVAWGQRPSMHDVIFSGGMDCTMRAWRYTQHPPEAFTGTENVATTTKEKKKPKKKEGKKIKEQTTEQVDEAVVGQAYIHIEQKVKMSKKYLFPLISKQISNCSIQGARKMLQNYVDSNAQCVDGKIEIPFFNSKHNMNIETDDETLPLKKDLTTEIVNKDLSSDEDIPKAEDKKASIDEREYTIEFIKMFGTTNDVNDILNMEMLRHLEKGNFEAWIMLCVLRGHIDTMMQFASAKDMLCPYLISIAPCVSFKYWKDATQLYLAQIDRLVAKGEEIKLSVFKNYGGTVYRKVGSLLSVHDIKGAVETFLNAGLYKEAYILCRTRHMDSIAQETLNKWAEFSCNSGNLTMCAICYLALGELSKAVSILSKANKEEHLCLAAEIAKVAGHTTYASQIQERTSNLKLKETVAENEDSLGELPTRMELLLRNENETTENSEEATNKPSLLENDKTEE